MQDTDDTVIARWRARMGLSQRATAQALGMSLIAYQEQERGRRFADDSAREASRALLLACAAIEAGIKPIE